MKQKFILSLAFFLAAFLPLQARALYPLTFWSSNQQEAFHIDMTYPLTGNVKIDQSLTGCYFDWLVDARALSLEDAQLLEDEDFRNEHKNLRSEYALTTEQFTAEDTVSFLFTSFYGRFAAVHSSTSYSAKTFRVSTGEQLTLESLTVEGQRPALIDMVSDYLLRDPEITEWADLDKEWFSEGLNNKEALDVFALRDDALIIQIEPYQIGPYALGAPRVEIPRAELVNILR